MTTEAALPSELRNRLQECGQSALIQHAEQLDTEQLNSLIKQLDGVPLHQLMDVFRKSKSGGATGGEEKADRAESAEQPAGVVLQPKSSADQAAWQHAAEDGAKLLSQGDVAVITVAGGQGSRLGFEHPKGLYPVGPVTDRSLFQIFAEQILARRILHKAPIPWMIMTSDATHDETVAFFQQHQFWGLKEGSVHFFRQGSLPALDASTGAALLEAPGRLCLAPDGHGGLIAALQRAGLLERMQTNGFKHVFYHQVDNPTAILCDPALLGWHVQRESQLTTNVVRKVTPTERMGVLVDLNGRTEIIEYSELTEQQAHRQDSAGDYIFWAGNTAIHVFSLAFLQELAEGDGKLPLHVAHKKIGCLDEAGTFTSADQLSGPNACKMERFIFDALPLASTALVVEGDREREFNPVKNAEGNDSPATSRAALNRIGRDWLKAVGRDVADKAGVEISPLAGPDLSTFQEKILGDWTARDTDSGWIVEPVSEQ